MEVQCQKGRLTKDSTQVTFKGLKHENWLSYKPPRYFIIERSSVEKTGVLKNKAYTSEERSIVTSSDSLCTSVTSHQAQDQPPTMVFFLVEPQHPPVTLGIEQGFSRPVISLPYPSTTRTESLPSSVDTRTKASAARARALAHSPSPGHVSNSVVNRVSFCDINTLDNLEYNVSEIKQRYGEDPNKRTAASSSYKCWNISQSLLFRPQALLYIFIT
uniref:Uncharacterized protein n=1 Tax=Timema shepardi TaxID=629360 RepID=A0A7R9APT7_TIMSH|nr:unnamed protein product [Timema shepardi]